ncbi:uncharacterized protein LOC116225091 [Clupea harengus]|uniref:Uncharacterized protein LOC116225091 n=1 Tax=Clupea harengus TaxID=7950 RepID=A0A6P8H5H7_CLUHA|nr:uncharacterized protein LOC116225091 [Clupea harengus]
MLSRNLLIASAVVFLATTVSTAPVEEKEPEETEVETDDGEEEVSEEDADDDDDSRSQDLNKGTGAQHATTVSKDQGATPRPGIFVGESSNGQKQTADGAAHLGQDALISSSAAGGVHGDTGSDPHSHSSDPSSHVSTVNGGGSTSETDTAETLEVDTPELYPVMSSGPGDHGSSVSQVHADSHPSTMSHDSASSGRGDSVSVHSQDHSQSDPAGDPFRDSSQIEAPGSSLVGSEVPETENNGVYFSFLSFSSSFFCHWTLLQPLEPYGKNV